MHQKRKILYIMVICMILVSCKQTGNSEKPIAPSQDENTQTTDLNNESDALTVLSEEIKEDGRVHLETMKENVKNVGNDYENGTLLYDFLDKASEKVSFQYVLLKDYDEEKEEWIVDPVQRKEGSNSPLVIENMTEEHVAYTSVENAHYFIGDDGSSSYFPLLTKEEITKHKEEWQGRLAIIYTIHGEILAIAKQMQV